MKAVVVGLGVQGQKRKKTLGKNFKYSVDKYKKADFKSIKKVPLKDYDSVFICTPDNKKIEVIQYCLKNKKHVLVEKPLLAKDNKILRNLERISKINKTIIYVAYNHRFEPGIIKLKKMIKSKKIGKLYKCRILYGNGTARLVKTSKWRDKKLGVISDLGSHLLDICFYLFGNNIKKFKILSASKFENKAPDYSFAKIKINNLYIDLEMSLCMWKNSFDFDLFASKGSLHLKSLCKWSKSIFIFRKRILPSGIPIEKKVIFKKGDKTWKLELNHFKKLIENTKKTNFKNNLYINKNFLSLNKNFNYEH